MSIRQRLFIGVFTAIVISAALAAYGLAALSAAKERMQRAHQDDSSVIAIITSSYRYEVALKSQVQEWKDLLLRGHTPADRAKYLAAFEGKAAAVQDELAKLDRQLKDLGLQGDQIEAIADEHRKLGGLYRDAFAQWKEGDDLTYRAIDALVRGKDRPLADLMKPMREKLDTAMNERREAVIAESQATHRQAMVVMWSAAGALAISFLLGGWWLARSITAPLDRLRGVLAALIRHDFAIPVTDTTRRDEVGEMARAVAAVKRSLEAEWKAVTRLRELAVELAANAASLKQASGGLAAAAEESSVQAASVSTAAQQASTSVSSVAAGSEEMTASIHEIAQNSTKAAGAANQATTQAKAAAKTVEELNELSHHIEGVAKTIAAIAEQTNLLALNATIEAARAGDAGRGFAVVASEVKELASKTHQATGEIGGRVNEVRTAIAHTVEAMGRVTGEVEGISGMQSAIAAAIEEQSATSQEMGRSMQQVATAATEIARAMGDVVTAAKGTAQGAQEASALAGSLERIAGDLRGLSDGLAGTHAADRPAGRLGA